MDESVTAIAHLSDLHFGAASRSAVSALLEDIDYRKPDIAVITGDLTQEGRKREFAEARDFLKSIPCPVMIVPGNHDLPVRNLWQRFISPYARFERYTGSLPNSAYSTDRITIAGLNSARRAAIDINWSYGRLSKRQIDNAAATLKKASSSSLKAIALHHPLTLGPGTAGARTVGRKKEILEKLGPLGLDIVLTGHVHHTKAETIIMRDRGVVIIGAGTATSLRTRNEPPAYNIINATKNNILVMAISLNNGRFTEHSQSRFAYHNNRGWHRLETAPLPQNSD